MQVRRRADVDGDDVVGDGRAVAAQHGTSVAVEARGLVMDEAGAGPRRQRRQVDVALLGRVMPGDEARQHAGIGRQHVARDERHRDAGNGPLGEAVEHIDLGVAAADEDEVLSGRQTAIDLISSAPVY